VDFHPDETQQAVVDSIAKLLDDNLGMEEVRAGHHTETAMHTRLWKALSQLGLFGLGLPEGEGGAGFGVAEQMLAMRELGRALAPGPVLATVLGAHLAFDSGRPELARAIAAGESPVGLAFTAQGSASVLADVVTCDVRTLDAAGSDLLLVVDGDRVALVRTADAQFQDRISTSIDPGVIFAPAWLDAVPAVVDGADDPHLLERAMILTAAALCGVGEAALRSSRVQVTSRVQFDKPIGSFQAVKHRCADMAVRAEAAWSQTTHAALLFDRSRSELGGIQVLAALVLAGESAVRNGADNIQNHGGMGFTAETDAHLFLRRAQTLTHCFGTRMQLTHEAARRPAE
jgi:alkylation response protein AidB-like acyl-CoA dehydrogenase